MRSVGCILNHQSFLLLIFGQNSSVEFNLGQFIERLSFGLSFLGFHFIEVGLPFFETVVQIILVFKDFKANLIISIHGLIVGHFFEYFLGDIIRQLFVGLDFLVFCHFDFMGKLFLVLPFLGQFLLLADQKLIVDIPQKFPSERGVVFEIQLICDQLYLVSGSSAEVIVLALLKCAVGDHTIAFITCNDFVLPAHVDVKVAGKTASVLITFLEFFSFLNQVLLLSLVCLVLPGLQSWKVLRFNGSVTENLIYFEKLAAVLIVPFDLLEGRIDPRFHWPIYMNNSAIFAKLKSHLL